MSPSQGEGRGFESHRPLKRLFAKREVSELKDVILFNQPKKICFAKTGRVREKFTSEKFVWGRVFVAIAIFEFGNDFLRNKRGVEFGNYNVGLLVPEYHDRPF